MLGSSIGSSRAPFDDLGIVSSDADTAQTRAGLKQLDIIELP
jgi:hypothetical protein